jgi:hypothetical protein
MAEVTITDGNGRARTPAALYQSLFEAGRAPSKAAPVPARAA